MSGSEPDETRVLLEKTPKQSSSSINSPKPTRLFHFLTSRQKSSGENSNDAFAQEMGAVDNSTYPPPSGNYGYLQHIQSLKPSFTPEDKSLPKKVRIYYNDQLELITSIEDILSPKSDESKDHATAYEKKYKRHIEILAMIVLITNLILVIVKLAVAILSKSLAVISSVVDSAVDLITSVTLMWTEQQIRKRDAYKYPGGRTRLEPIAIVILSVIMCSACVQVIYESSEVLYSDVEYFTHRNDPSSPYKLPDIDMGVIAVSIMVITIVSKAILFVLCYRIKNPTMYALAEDNRNDVASNVGALVCGLIASNALRGNIKQEAIVIDPIGAIVISLYIIIAWILQANRQVRRLTGISAEPYFLQRLTHVVYNYRPDVVTKIDMIQAVHHGTNFFVEVHIGLPASMPLSTAHDIGEGLQSQLESINDIDRAFVHLDFEFTHMPSSEHKII